MTALLWTFPLLMFASVVVGWAAEVTAVHLSAGMALAILAWLQTAPEFAVEATIAWHRDAHLALANLTGSLRLLLGFGWPMIFFIHWAGQRRRKRAGGEAPPALTLPESFAVEAAGLGLPIVYFSIIYLKRTWTMIDGGILCLLYCVYFLMLNRERKHARKLPGAQLVEEHDDDDEAFVVRKVLGLSKTGQIVAMLGLFVIGGAGLYVTVHPFIDALKAVAVSVGVSEFVFIQWIAPVASELPEKITAFNWARRPRKVSMAVVNMLSSVTSQWTLLAGLVPIVFSISAGHPYVIEFDAFQRQELLLTMCQSAVAVVLLLDLKIRAFEMIGFFTLWAVQFLMPSTREYLPSIYLFWSVAECARLAITPRALVVPRALRRLLS